jgi:hypothetical protein
MTYAVVGILFVLVVGGLVLALTMRATSGSTPASPDSRDDTAVGDTPQHSESEDGGPAEPGPVEPGSGRFKRDPIGGEAQAETTIDVR